VTVRTTATGLVLLLALAACGGESKSEREHEQEGLSQAADRNTCLAQAHKATLPKGFPQDFPFPARTVVYSVEDRGDAGMIATGVTDLPFKQVLAALNGPAQKAGFKVTNGETEEHDAEANWEGNGYRGRWAIRESGTCDGETVVQVLALQQ
jgi:hypothetical protein